MKKIIILIGIIVVLILIVFNLNKDSNYLKSKNKFKNDAYSEFLDKYSGSYTIEIEGNSSLTETELYVLASNGRAKWFWITKEPYKEAKVQSEKSGNWTADKSSIEITISGNTGNIQEDFSLVDGKFISTISADRYLKKIENID